MLQNTVMSSPPSKTEDRLGSDLLKVLVGQTVSVTGDQFGAMALSILILQYTGSAMAMSMNAVLSLLPTLLFGPTAGLMLDRLNRKRVLVIVDVARALLTLGMGWIIFSGRFSLALANTWSVLTSLLKVLYVPGTMALIPALVPPGELQRANALQSFGNSIAVIFGPGLAGLVIKHLGPWYAFAINAISFGVSASAISLAKVRYDEMPVKTGRPKMSELRDGFLFFRSVPLASMLLVTTMVINACNQPSGIALNVHILRTFRSDAVYLGGIASASAAASLVSSLVVASRKRWSRLGLMVSGAVAVTGLAFGIASVTPWLSMVVVAFLLRGFAGPMLNTAVQTLYQDITPPDIRGRVFALRVSFSQLLSPISFAVSGVLLDGFGSRAVFAGLAILLLILSGILVTRKEIRDV